MKKYILTVISTIIVFMNGCKTTQPKEPEVLQAELRLDAQAILGEGAIWNFQTGKLWWVDIEEGLLQIFDPVIGTNEYHPMGQRIGTVVPTETGNAVVALENGIYTFDMMQIELFFMVRPEEHSEGIRFNDGKCDPAGRLWVGSMAMEDPVQYRSFLYRVDHDHTAHTMIDSITVSNGICWSLDKTKMYYIDTPTRQVQVFDYDDQTGNISNGRIAIDIPEGIGYPDGMTIDAKGNLWVCMWGGSSVCCWNPETGELVTKVEVPAKNVTSCAFGGEDLKTLFITTASIDMSDEDQEKFPEAGGIFAVEPGVKGVEAFFFKDN